MASNKDLRTEIETLCAERGVSVPEALDRMGNPKLLEVLEGLRREPSAGDGNLPGPVIETAVRPLVAAAPPEETDPSQDNPTLVEGPPALVEAPYAATPTAPAKAPSVANTGAPGYYVAEGKTVSTLRRETMGAFQVVYPNDFSDGQGAVEKLLADGYLFKR